MTPPRAVGLGCMRLSTEATRPEPATARAIVDAAIAAGVTLVDTADVYCHSDADLGHNEQLLADLPAHVRVVTKGGLTRPGGAWVPNGRAKHLAAAARASRARLGRIDLYLLHAIDPKVPLTTSVRALAKLLDDEIVPAIGLSNVNLTQLESALAIAPISAVEVELHPYKLDALRGGLLDACTDREITVLAHRPLGGPRGIARLSRDPVVRAHASRLSCTPAELILAWLRSLSRMVVPLPGASRSETALSAANVIELDDVAKTALDEHFVTVGRPAQPPAVTVGSAGGPAAYRGLDDGGRTASGEQFVTVGRAGGSAVVTGLDDGGRTASGEQLVTAKASPRPVAGSNIGEIKNAPGEVVLVIGIPGAGKSTLARELVTRGYTRLNRDDRGGSLLELARALDEELANGATRAVLDNTYPSRASRRPVIDIARRHGLAVRCVVVDTPIERAQHNAVARMLDKHGRLLEPTELRGADIGPGAQFRWRREYEPPREDEGFDAIDVVPFASIETRRADERRPTEEHDNERTDDERTDDERTDDERTDDERTDDERVDDERVDDERVDDERRPTEEHDNKLRGESELRRTRGELHPAILVELDDIVWRGRPRTVEKVALHDGAREALRTWHDAGYAIAVTSWQPGVAPTRFAELVERLAKLLDVTLRASACFHAAGPPVCWCRKPLPGLALAMARQHGLRFEVCIGSGAADRGFAARARIPFHDVRDGWPNPRTTGPRPGTMDS